MAPFTVIVVQAAVDFQKLVAICHQALGYNPSAAADASAVELSATERYLSCLSAIRDSKAPAGVSPTLLHHISQSVLIIADERDTLDILNACAGMPSMSVDTLSRGMILTVIHGTLGQWKNAVFNGTARESELNVRACFCKVMHEFKAAGIDVWKDCNIRPLNDHTFYLEDKRR